jgi:hypothetical protein
MDNDSELIWEAHTTVTEDTTGMKFDKGSHVDQEYDYLYTGDSFEDAVRGLIEFFTDGNITLDDHSTNALRMFVNEIGDASSEDLGEAYSDSVSLVSDENEQADVGVEYTQGQRGYTHDAPAPYKVYVNLNKESEDREGGRTTQNAKSGLARKQKAGSERPLSRSQLQDNRI